MKIEQFSLAGRLPGRLSAVLCGLLLLCVNGYGQAAGGDVAGYVIDLRDYYARLQNRHVIQFDPRCAVYDDEVFYRLKPGSCTHQGPGFKNTYYINSLGTRDDEQSLTAPEIIAIGDSHTMGWGVDQNETYTQILERRTGRSALNMGVSSFGTVRELIFLKRANTKKLKYLIIQYDDNDLRENLAYLGKGNKLIIHPRPYWEALTRFETRSRPLWSNESLGIILGNLAYLGTETMSVFRREKDLSAELHARTFFSVLSSCLGPELSKARIIVFDLNNDRRGRYPDESSFFKAATLLKASKEFEGFPDRIEVLELGEALNDQRYRLVLDNHLNAEGHKFIAEAILKHLGLK